MTTLLSVSSPLIKSSHEVKRNELLSKLPMLVQFAFVAVFTPTPVMEILSRELISRHISRLGSISK